MTTATPPVDMRGAHTRHHLRGSHGRLRHRLLIYFAGALAVIIGLGALGSILGGPKQHLCQPFKPCVVPKVARPLVNQTVWQSSRYGFSLEYPGNALSVVRQSPAGLFLGLHLTNGHTAAILVQGFSETSLAQAIRNQIAGLSGITQVATDTLAGFSQVLDQVRAISGIAATETSLLLASVK